MKGIRSAIHINPVQHVHHKVCNLVYNMVFLNVRDAVWINVKSNLLDNITRNVTTTKRTHIQIQKAFELL